jgi:hypothetical protein
MATEVRHCERCDHEFEVEVTSGTGDAQVEGCPEGGADCGLANPHEHVKIIRELD